jgi:outer membrane protein TolC
MIPEPRQGRRWRPRLTGPVAVLVATLAGCAAADRPPSAVSLRPDVMDVSTVAPAINAGPPRDQSVRRSVDEAPTPIPTQDPAESPTTPTMTPSVVKPEEGLSGPAPDLATPAASTPPSIPESSPPRPIDLPSALRLADNQNPVIGEARVLILGALAQRTAARALLLPYLNAGANYHDHTGPVQRSTGTILKLTDQSFYFGGGAGAVGTGTPVIPMVSILTPLTDAIYEPLAAQQRVIGARFNASDTANKVLLEVASLYIDLIGAENVLRVRREIAAESDRLAERVAAFAATGQGRASDADRADADRRFYQADIQRAEERVAVASALLAERLNLDPSNRLEPIVGPLEPVILIDPETPTESLLQAALARRPDLASREALVAEARYQVKKEQSRPLLPTIWLGFSAGDFGGGSNLIPPALGHFSTRNDFDVRAYWTVLNLGAGNVSLIRQRKARENQAIADRVRVLNEVRQQVASARAESLAQRFRIEVARGAVRTATEGYEQDTARLRETLARPIEVLDNLRLLSDARVALIDAITLANKAQFALFVSLGAPPPLEAMPGVGALGN